MYAYAFLSRILHARFFRLKPRVGIAAATPASFGLFGIGGTGTTVRTDDFILLCIYD
jgi:hypothetical protein